MGPTETYAIVPCAVGRRRAFAFHEVQPPSPPRPRFLDRVRTPPSLQTAHGGRKDGLKDPRFLTEHSGDPEYSLVTRSSDGRTRFLANMLSKMKHGTAFGSRIAEVHNGARSSPGTPARARATSAAGSSRTTSSRIVALPLNMFYNTGIATYIWVLSNRKLAHRRGKVQLIDWGGERLWAKTSAGSTARRPRATPKLSRAM